MKRVKGIGGIFFKSDHPKNLYAWYEKHLGIEASADGMGATSNCMMRGARRLRASATR